MKNLPVPRDIAEARLCIPITNATPQAPTMIGAALLNKSFELMRPYNLENVGELIVTTIIPKYPKPADAK